MQIFHYAPKKSNNYGIVYVLTNPAISDMVKIGMTKKIYTSGNVGAHPCGRPDDNTGDCVIRAGASPAPTAAAAVVAVTPNKKNKMTNNYNPNIHHRRSIRLKGYNYSQEGLYFVTICCQHNICRFGKIENGVMVLNQFGKIAHDEWVKLSERYSNAFFEIFQIMPNHIHGIIEIVGAHPCGRPDDNAGDCDVIGAVDCVVIGAGDCVVIGAGDCVVIGAGANNGIGAGASPAPTAIDENMQKMPTVGNIVGAYKSLVTNKCLEIYKSHNVYMGKLWQRDYYEHIIRNDRSFQRIVNYIENNPVNWEKDKFYHP